jgi:hypothetical protein
MGAVDLGFTRRGRSVDIIFSRVWDWLTRDLRGAVL